MATSVLVFCAVGFLCFGAVFQAVGFAIPFWTGIETEGGNDTISIHVGLWYVSACVQTSCTTKVIRLDFSHVSSGMVDMQGETTADAAEMASQALGRSIHWIVLVIVATISTGLTILVIPLVIGCRRSKGALVFVGCIMFLAALLGLGVSIMYAAVLNFIFQYKLLSVSLFPWSLAIFGVGGILTLVSAILVIVALCKWDSQSDDFDDMFGEDPQWEMNKAARASALSYSNDVTVAASQL